MFRLNLTGDTIIFVDIDGPLLPARMHYAKANYDIVVGDMECSWQDDIEKKCRIQFDPCIINALNKWVEEAEAKIVLSTNWTKYSTKEEMQKILSLNGFDHAYTAIHADWKTTKHKAWTRGEEISYWLSHYRGAIKNYMILDDDISVLNHPHLDPKKVLLADFFDGITWRQIFEGFEIFGIVDYK